MVHSVSTSQDKSPADLLLEAWLDNLGLEEATERQWLEKALERLQQQAGKLPPASAEAFIRRRCGSVDILHQVLSMDAETLTVALLAEEDNSEKNRQGIKQQFGAQIAGMVQGVLRMDVIRELKTHRSEEMSGEQTEKLRKMLLAMAKDARVVLIKLAECLYDMRMLRYSDQAEQKKNAQETLDIFAPLANRLGIWKIKWELEDLAFRYLHPDEYKHLSTLLDERRSERETYIGNIAADLKKRLLQAGVQAEISGRPKHIYSIWKKMQRKGVEFNQLFDIMALRALVDDVTQCYIALGIIHNSWQPILGEFDDYIAVPKKNGYKSLHTAVFGPQNKPFEVQIRTHEMHRFAEFGVASHWRYKEAGVAHDRGFEQKIEWLRQVLQNREEEGDGDILDEFHAEIVEDRVYVLSPQGRVVDLRAGSTALDFAYAIHTSIGHRCKGAKINHKIAPLTQILKTGDVVEILATKEENPSRNWMNPKLGFLKSHSALSKVRNWFNKQDAEHHLAEGRTLLEKELQRLNVANPNQEQLAKELKYPGINEMLLALGRGTLSTSRIAALLDGNLSKSGAEFVEPVLHTAPHRDKQPNAIKVQGVDGLLTQMAGCCKPMPPDRVTGYITRGHGITIHRHDCEQVAKLKQTEPERLLDVAWESQPASRKYPVDIEIDAYDRSDLLRDISNIFSAEKINITALQSGKSRNADDMLSRAKVIVTIEINGMEQLSLVMGKIDELANVFSVRRK